MNSSHFINMFYGKFKHKFKVEKENLIKTWLHSAGLPQEVSNLEILQTQRSSLFIEVEESHREILDNLKHKKMKKHKEFEDLELVLRLQTTFV